MDRLFHYRYSLREHLFPLIGLALCFYFSYHIIYGERSLTKWIALSKRIETVSKINDNLEEQKTALERRVIMMRPGSINKDLLEERVRLVLGYTDRDEQVILRTSSYLSEK